MSTSEHIQFKNVSGWIRKAFSSPTRPTWAQKHNHLAEPRLTHRALPTLLLDVSSQFPPQRCAPYLTEGTPPILPP